MRVAIIGASGLVGGNCLRRWQAHTRWAVLGTHFSYPTPDTQPYNTLEPDAPGNVDLRGWQPDWIVHCGALTHVDYCEQHPDESYAKTVQALENTATLAQEIGARLVYISSDYVFDGEAGPYTEERAVNPLSVYGKHKLKAERLAQGLVPGALIIRITNVYGHEARNKNFIMRLVEQIRASKPLTLRLPMDQYATPVNAYDVARALERLMRDRAQGVYNVAGTDWMNRCQLTDRVLKAFPQAEVAEYTRLTTAELGQAAPRPLLGGLISKKLLDRYPGFAFSTVDDFLAELQ